MRAVRPAALLLALLLGLSGSAAWASRLSNDGTDQALQQELQRLDALRTADTPAFVAGMAAVAARPLPTNAAQRDYLTFLLANQAVLQGRFAEAMAIARPLANNAEDPALRFRAGGFLVNMLAGTREFEEGLRRLGRLLEQARTDEQLPTEERNRLWGVASTLYNEMGQHDLARRYAEQVLSQQPSPRTACSLTHQALAARVALSDAALREPEFEAGVQVCSAAAESIAPGFIRLFHARFLRQRQGDTQALALLNAHLPAIDATAYPRLTAEAHALRAELLLQGGRVDEAVVAANQALALAKDAPTSTPAAMAHKVLFEAAKRNGDSDTALVHLQAYVAAERALADEALVKERAFRTAQHEGLQREQELVLATQRNAVLELQARVAKAESQTNMALLALVSVCLLVVSAWGWRMVRQRRALRVVAEVDALTGLASRVHFATQAQAALARAAKQGQSAALVLFDLDFFKQVNDRYGHLSGDAVLRAVCAEVRVVPQQGVLLGRLGGEEFAALLVGVTPDQVLAYAERCRRAVASARAEVAGQSLSVTASFGVVFAKQGENALPDLLARADRALYLAKNNGRDRVCTEHGAPLQVAA